MKNILLLFIGLFVAATINAQNNSVIITTKTTGDTLNGTIYTIYGDGARKEIKEEFRAVMTSQDSMLVGIKRTEIKYITGTKDFFCWYLCYSEKDAGTLPVWIADDSLWMYQDSVITNFSVYLWPEGNMGQAQYRYTFYPENNPSDSSWIDVLFDIVSVGINDVSEDDVSMFPNPASQVLNVEIPNSLENETVQLQVVDMTGRTVIQERINSGLNNISLDQNIENGSYLVRITSSSQIIYKKILQIRR